MTMIRYALALSAAVAVGSLALAANPAAAATAMADCNKQWNDSKAANKTNGATYQDFLKGCLKAAPAADAKATDAKAVDKTAADKAAADTKAAEMKAKDAKAKTDAAAKAKADTAAKATPAATDTKAKPAVVATDAKAVDPEAAAKKDCGKQWKAIKDAGTEGTQKKKDFVAACLTKAGIVMTPKADTKAMDAKATDAKMADEPTPPEPTVAAATPAKATTTDATAKPRTAGQLAMDKRIKECGVLWQKSKGADGLVNGLKWPQYWSQCNTKMKAAGG